MIELEKYMIHKIEKSKPHIIEAFVNEYGEKYRDYITDRIKHTKVLICHGNIDKYYIKSLATAISLNNLDDDNIKKGIDKLYKVYLFLDNYENLCKEKFSAIFPNIVNKPYSAKKFYEGMLALYQKPSREISQTKINQNRVYYYKCLGLDLGPYYSSYKDRKELKNYAPSKEQFKAIEEEYTHLRLLKSQAVSMLENNYKEINKELKVSGYDIPVTKIRPDEKLNDQAVSFCQSNSMSGRTTPICMFNLYTLMSANESVYLHEFSHALDSQFKNNKSGLSYDRYNITLNEAFNEASIQPIYKYMLDHNYGIIYKNPSKYSSSGYKPILKIGEALVEKFKDDIPTIKFGSKKDLLNLIDDRTLSRWDSIAYEILNSDKSNKDLDYYRTFLEDNILREIKEYNRPNQKR